MTIHIGNSNIGIGYPCFIIAEAGVNHNGSMHIAKKLVDAAKNAGADAIKFQTFKAENIVTKNAEMAAYQKKNLGSAESQYALLKKLELSEMAFFELKKYCERKGILFLSTPHSSQADVDLVATLCPAIKVGSGDLTNIPILEYIAAKGLPIILATGMSTLLEVQEAVDTIRKKNKRLVVLHCTTNYPTPPEDVNMRAMLTMQKQLKVLVGYSDHTTSLAIPVAAVAMGACMIEKHFTLDKKMKGPDHRASIEPASLKLLVEMIRQVEQSLGSGKKKPTRAEKKIMSQVRKSIVAGQLIRKGKKFTCQMLAVKRPNTGIPPKYYKKIIGKKATQDIAMDEHLRWNMISK